MQDQMKQHLVDSFKYNSWANMQLLDAISLLPDPAEAVKLFSHLITSQDKWMNRITQKLDDNKLAWFGEIFALEDIRDKWHESVSNWIRFLESNDASEIEKEIVFTRAVDGKKISVRILDIALQLNYHSIHHRAQINKMIREQGSTPPATDYILTVLKEVQ
jgi:uncharacterized damage-inducible protein DinB